MKIALAERNKHRDLYVMAAPDTIDVIATRVRNLLSHGRRITVVSQYLDSPNGLRVETGLNVDTKARDGGIHAWSNADGGGISVYLRPGISGFGIAGYTTDDATEEQAWRRYHNKETKRRNITHVEIEGGCDGDGPGHTDQIRITTWNQHGVAEQVIVAFDQGPDRQERAEHGAAILDQLAAQRETWAADDLRKLAERCRYEWKTVTELATKEQQ